MSFSETIRQKRRELGFSVRELCRKANLLPGISQKVTWGYYSQIEHENVITSRVSIDTTGTLFICSLAPNQLTNKQRP